MTLEWLNQLLDPEYRKVMEGKRLLLSRPWQIGSHVMATNGYLLVSVTGSGFTPAPADVTERFLKVMTLANPSLMAALDAAEIREWLGSPVGDVAEECEVCDGRGQHECDCGDEHDCHACKGDGTISVQSVRNGTVGGLIVDRESLSVPFQHLEGGVLIEKDQSDHDSTVGVIRFAGPDWSVLVTVKTGKKEDYPDETWPELLKGATT